MDTQNMIETMSLSEITRLARLGQKFEAISQEGEGGAMASKAKVGRPVGSGRASAGRVARSTKTARKAASKTRVAATSTNGEAPRRGRPPIHIVDEGKVLAFITKKGEVARSEVQKVFKLSEDSSARLMKKLLADKQIVAQGKTATRKYLIAA